MGANRRGLWGKGSFAVEDFPSCEWYRGPWGLTSLQNKHQVFGTKTKMRYKEKKEGVREGDEDGEGGGGGGGGEGGEG